jgi:hypothetical protein
MQMYKGTEIINYMEEHLGDGGSAARSYCHLGAGAPWCNAEVTLAFHEIGESKLYCDGRKEIGCPHSIKWCYKNLASLPIYLALEGDIVANLSYRAMYSWRKSWGNIFMPRTEPVTQNACMLEASYNVPRVKGLQLNMQLALDHGSLYNGYAAKADGSHTNFGALLAVRYRLGL